MLYLGLILLAAIALLIAQRLQAQAHSRALADGSFARRHVYIEEDGGARELTPDEIAHLSRSFHPNDGNRPYIKRKYESLTPDGKRYGYLPRWRLPQGISIRPSSIGEMSER